jgi:hypothetical protein
MSSLVKQDAKKRGRKPKEQGPSTGKSDGKKPQKIDEDSYGEDEDMSYEE